KVRRDAPPLVLQLVDDVAPQEAVEEHAVDEQGGVTLADICVGHCAVADGERLPVGVELGQVHASLLSCRRAVCMCLGDRQYVCQAPVAAATCGLAFAACRRRSSSTRCCQTRKRPTSSSSGTTSRATGSTATRASRPRSRRNWRSGTTRP